MEHLGDIERLISATAALGAAKAAGITVNNDQALTVTFNRKF